MGAATLFSFQLSVCNARPIYTNIYYMYGTCYMLVPDICACPMGFLQEICAENCKNFPVEGVFKGLEMAARRVATIPSEANQLLLTDYYLTYSTQQLTL